jgi:hypothetical protein
MTGRWQQGFEFARDGVEPHVASSYFSSSPPSDSTAREEASAHCRSDGS